MKRKNKVSSCMHTSISVEGVLNQYRRKKITFCENDDGTPMSDKDARNVFTQAHAEGKKFLPMGDCYRFDYENGCKGHIKSIMPNDEKELIIEKEFQIYLLAQKIKVTEELVMTTFKRN